MSSTQEQQNSVEDEHAAVDHHNHSHNSDDLEDSEVAFSLIIISIAQI